MQILQVIHGAAEKRLRTPRIHEALEALASIGVLDPAEAAELAAAYRFFRRLINGLRMLRGSAQDLFLPNLESDEYVHLARRMGYAPELGWTPAQKLHLDFETHSAGIRAFVERRLGREVSRAPSVTVADLVLSDAVAEGPRLAALAERGSAILPCGLRPIAGEAERRRSSRALRSLPATFSPTGPTPTWPSTTGRASCTPSPIPAAPAPDAVPTHAGDCELFSAASSSPTPSCGIRCSSTISFVPRGAGPAHAAGSGAGTKQLLSELARRFQSVQAACRA